MTKRRRTQDDHQRAHYQADDDFIPLPIQTFLWRQTSPFVRPFIGKAKDLALIEQRDACKLFERIIITNNVWGQSVSLTDAIASIDRWRLIKVSFPFVLQCTAALLNNKLIKDHNFNRLGGNEAKMMYTLQWILMNASEECADSENEAKSNATNVAFAAATSASLLRPSDGGGGGQAIPSGQPVTSQVSNSSLGPGQALDQQQQPQQSTSQTLLATVEAAASHLTQSHRNQTTGRMGSTSSCAGAHQSIVIPAAAAVVAFAQPATISTLRMQSTLPSSSSSVSPIGSSTPTKPLTPTNPPASCPSNYLLPISSIQMFVYYFAPIMDGLKHSDFLSSNQRLEIGSSLWEPLFFHQLPDINCLKAQIKPQSQFAADSVAGAYREPSARGLFVSVAGAKPVQPAQSAAAAAAVRQAEHLVSIMSARDRRRRSSSIMNDPAQFGDVFLGAPTPSAPSGAATIAGSTSKATAATAATANTATTATTAPATSATTPIIPEQTEAPGAKARQPAESQGVEPTPSSSGGGGGSSTTYSNMEQSAILTRSLYATYLDVAVLRCLFITDWQESGVFWGLNYLSNRLLEHLYVDSSCKELDSANKVRNRSKSLSCIDSSDIRRNITAKRDQFKQAYGKRTDRLAGHQHQHHPGQQYYASHQIRVSQDESISSQPEQMLACSVDRAPPGDSRGRHRQSSGAGGGGGQQFLRVEDPSDGPDSAEAASKEPKSPVRRLSFSSGMQTLANQIRKTSKRVKKHSDSRQQSGEALSSGSQVSINQAGQSTSRYPASPMRGRRSSSADDLSSGQLSALSLLQQQQQGYRGQQDNKSMTESNPVITVTPNNNNNLAKQLDPERNKDNMAKQFASFRDDPEADTGDSLVKVERQYLVQSLYTKSLRHLERLTRSQSIPRSMRFSSQLEGHKDLVEKSESVGANHYVDQQGRIDPLVVLKVLHSISQRDGACSQRVCDKLLLLMTRLINIGILKSNGGPRSGDSGSSLELRRDLVKLLPTKLHRLQTLDRKFSMAATDDDGAAAATSKQQADELRARNLMVHKMLIDIVFRLHHHLGCPNQCGMKSSVDNHHRGHQQMQTAAGTGAGGARANVVMDASSGRNLRLKLRDSLKFLCNYERDSFVKYVQDVSNERPLQLVLDILHSSLGFCRPDYLAYLRHNNTNSVQQQQQAITKQAGSQSVQFANEPSQSIGAADSRASISRKRAQGASTSCGQQAQQPQAKATGGPDEVVENIIVSNSFKQLITRISMVSKELKFQENTSLYSDIRKLISFIRENYCSTFRSIVLSALIDCTKLLSQQEKTLAGAGAGTGDGPFQIESRGAHDSGKPVSDDESMGLAGEPGAEASLGLGTENPIQSIAQQQRSPTNDFESQTSRQHRTSLGSQRAAYQVAGPKSQRQASPVQGTSQQHSQQDQQQTNQGGGILSLSKAKKKLEQAFGGKQSGKVSKLGEDLGALSSSVGEGEHSSAAGATAGAAAGAAATANLASSNTSNVDETSHPRSSLRGHQSSASLHETSKGSQSQSFVAGIIPAPLGPASIMIIKQNQLIYKAVQTGMANFSFLMESCLPGDLLDPALLAALLDLRSPIAIRAAIYLECANFVHKCNRGQWPTWMRVGPVQHRNSTAGQPLGGSKFRKSSCIQRSARNNTIMYRTAGRAFYAWAEAVGTRLEELMLQEQERELMLAEAARDPSNCLGGREEAAELASLQQPADIDFLQSSLNGDSSPFALKMAACQLLFEVTTFLRETYRYLKPTSVQHQMAGSKGGDKMSSIYDVSRAVTANRRWSMALSSLGFGQLPASLNALQAGTVGTSAGHHKGQGSGAPTATPSISEHPERRISFVLHETKDEQERQDRTGRTQEASSISSTQHEGDQQQLALQQQDTNRKLSSARHLSQSSASSAVVVAAATLLRSSGVIDSQYHRRKSIKLRRGAQEKQEKQDKKTKFAQDFDEEAENSSISDAGVRRTDSLRSRRRVSGISEKSDTSDRGNLNAPASQQGPAGGGGGSQAQGEATHQSGAEMSGNESAGNGSCEYADQAADVVERSEADEARIMSNMPWFRAIGLVNARIDCKCSHFPACNARCYKIQQGICKRLISFVQTIYQDPTEHEYVSSMFEKRLTNLMNMSTSSGEAGRLAARNADGSTTNIAGCPPGGHSDGEQSAPSRLRKDKRVKKQHHADSLQDDHQHQHQSPGSKSFSRKHDKSNRVQSMMTPVDPSAPANGLSTMVADTIKALTAAKVKERGLEEPPLVRYLRFNVKSLLHCPMAAFLKGAMILPRESFVEMLEFSWNLLLEDDQHLARTAAVCFIISSIKCPSEASKLLLDELDSGDASRKMSAINKFYVVWDSRYQCWPRLEDGAYVSFKMAPPSIEFTLPSPKIAQESSPVVDPPWIPRKTSNVEEVTIGQDQTVQKSFVTATKTRRKQQIELVSKALKEKHDKLREDREKYHITSVPITLYAAYEPTLGQQGGGGGDEMDGGGGGAAGPDDDTQQESRALLQMKTAQVLFPTCLCQAAIVMINLLDDSRVTYEGSAVYEIASKAIWSCLVEDPALFLRYFFERLTRQNQSTIFQVLRRLIRFMPRLPPQAAYTLYNYLIGFIIYYIRCPVESSQKLIADTLSVLCLVVPSVHGLFLKDLKQILRKEQCDHNLLITANVPSAKKIIVHGSDSSGIPSQFPIDEATQFYHILLDSLEFFGIERDKQNEYFLIDVRTNLMHNLHSYVRDHYSFKRSQHPQLQLINMNPSKAFDILQRQEFINQFMEFGKVSMSLSIVKSSHMAVQRALFLHEELMKLPTFPRKALETNFSLFKGPLGHQVFSMDRVHKICWVRVIARMFELTSGFFLQLGDIQLFLNAISGIFVLHCEEASVSRLCLATFINATHQFKSIFASDGFIPIMSTIIQVYSNHQNNQLLCRSIEFVCKQFYIMHRKPFLLQLFGSVASRLNTAEMLQQNQSNFPIGHNQPSGSSASSNLQVNDPSRISPAALFRLLQSLEKAFKDPLDILELVEAEKPLKAVDFCYQHDKEVIEILDIISLCVTVTAYASESPRSTQMLIILESIVPLYMKHLQASTSKKAGQSMGKQAHKDELQKIQSISICIRTLIVNCEGLTRNFNGPLPSIDFRSSSIRRLNPNSGGGRSTSGAGQQQAKGAAGAGATNSAGLPMDICNDEHSFTGPERPIKRGGGGDHHQSSSGGGGGAGAKQTTFVKGVKNFNSDESEITRGEFIVPRDTLLNLVAEFLALSTGRLVESAKKYVELHQKHSSYELLDVKSHLRLAEVANSLLKFASTDPSVMACRGLIRYMNEILPNTEWRQEAIRPALITILKRLDKTFNRIAKKNWVKKSTDWEAAKQLLKGAYLTFIKHPYIVHLPHLKSLISCCQNIILSDGLQSTPSITANLFHGFSSSAGALATAGGPVPTAGAEGNFLNVVASSGGQPGGQNVAHISPSGSGLQPASAPVNSQTLATSASGVGPFAPTGSQTTPSLAAVTAAAALADRLASNNANNSATSQGFNLVTIRLIAMQLLQTGDNQTLESFLGNSMNTPEKLESVMLNFIYPMCIRVCSGARDSPKLRTFDIMYILNIVLNMLAPQSASSRSCSSTAYSPKAATDTSQFILSKITTTIGSTQTGATALGIVGSAAHSVANTHQIVAHQESLKIGFLGLKILCVCFESQLASEWVRLARLIRDLALQPGQPGGPLWDFLDFVATYRFPLFILLLPTIKYDLSRKIKVEQAGNKEQAAHYLQCLRLILAKIHGAAPTGCRSKSFLFVSLTAELRMLKEQLIAKRRQMLEGERQPASSSNLSSHHQLQATGGGSSSPNQAGAGPSGLLSGGGASGEVSQVSGDHFTAYHRLSAAIASFANQGASQGKMTPSSSSGAQQQHHHHHQQQQQQMGASAALKGACFVAQLATSAPIGPQLSGDGNRSPGIGDARHEPSQGSIRLSTAKSREEARKVMNTILRRTSYPHNQASLQPPDQAANQAAGPSGERKGSQPPSPSASASLCKNQRQIEMELANVSKNQLIMDPAMLMAAAFPAPKRSNVEGSGILKQLVQTIDRQNQKSRQQQPSHSFSPMPGQEPEQSTGYRQVDPEEASASDSTSGSRRKSSQSKGPASHVHEYSR